MNQGGFPPLFFKKNLTKKSDQKELKSQFFSETDRKNVNIREILTNQKIDLTLKDNNLNTQIKEIDSF